MATGKHEPVEVEKAEVPSSPGQATPNLRQNQPPSITPDGDTEPGSPPISDAAYKIDEKSSNTESELRALLHMSSLLTHYNQGPEKEAFITRLRLAVGLSVRPSDMTIHHRIPSIKKPRETEEFWTAGHVLIW